MFDFHRHFTNSKPIDTAFYSTSSIEEWDYKAQFMSFGILANNIDRPLIEIENLLEKNIVENNMSHIGEIGLDNRFTNLNDQILVFKKALSLASKYNRILTIHIVGCNNVLVKILTEHKNNLPKHIIYHGFNKSIELATQLKKFNTIVSINPSIIRTKLFKNIEQLDKIGFLVESDWDLESDIGYKSYLDTFTKNLEAHGASKFKDINNEFSTILKNF